MQVSGNLVNLVKLLCSRDRIELEGRPSSMTLVLEWLFGHEITERSGNVQHKCMNVAVESLANGWGRNIPGFLRGDQLVAEGCIMSKGELWKKTALQPLIPQRGGNRYLIHKGEVPVMFRGRRMRDRPTVPLDMFP